MWQAAYRCQTDVYTVSLGDVGFYHLCAYPGTVCRPWFETDVKTRTGLEESLFRMREARQTDTIFWWWDETAVAVPVVIDLPGNSPRNSTRVETIRVNQPTYVCYLMWINRGNDSWVLCFAVVSGISRPLNQIWYFRWFYLVTTHFFPCLLYNQRYPSMHNKMTRFWVQTTVHCHLYDGLNICAFA